MKVTRAQAEQNHRKIIHVASRLFRERGYDGVGLTDLMKGAGLTQGGFYKRFKSKEDLAIQATAKAFESSKTKWREVAAKAMRKPLSAIVRFYLSDEHRQQIDQGCVFAALASDSTQRSAELRAVFDTAVAEHLNILESVMPANKAAATGECEDEGDTARDRSIVALSTMVGGLILSRSIKDDQLASDFLRVAANGVLKQAAGTLPDEKKQN